MGSISLFIFFITLLVLARQVGPNIIILMVSLSACCFAVMEHLYCACFISLNLLYFWIRDIYCSWHFWLGMIKSTFLLAWHQCENHPSIRFTFSLPLAYKFDSQSGKARSDGSALYISIFLPWCSSYWAQLHKETPNTAVDIYLDTQGYYLQAPDRSGC